MQLFKTLVSPFAFASAVVLFTPAVGSALVVNHHDNGTVTTLVNDTFQGHTVGQTPGSPWTLLAEYRGSDPALDDTLIPIADALGTTITVVDDSVPGPPQGASTHPQYLHTAQTPQDDLPRQPDRPYAGVTWAPRDTGVVSLHAWMYISTDGVGEPETFSLGLGNDQFAAGNNVDDVNSQNVIRAGWPANGNWQVRTRNGSWTEYSNVPFLTDEWFELTIDYTYGGGIAGLFDTFELSVNGHSTGTIDIPQAESGSPIGFFTTQTWTKNGQNLYFGAVPEPSSLALIGLAAPLLIKRRRRR